MLCAWRLIEVVIVDSDASNIVLARSSSSSWHRQSDEKVFRVVLITEIIHQEHDEICRSSADEESSFSSDLKIRGIRLKLFKCDRV